jgi:alpha-tubulin suppressor-like RCC1 family protein
VACGAEHTVCLTEEGGVFSFGSGQYGQLGHGSKSDEQLPRKIIELMGTEVTQIECGKKHTLAFVPTRGRLYAFGLGGSGQLGNSAYSSFTTPQGKFLVFKRDLAKARSRKSASKYLICVLSLSLLKSKIASFHVKFTTLCQYAI